MQFYFSKHCLQSCAPYEHKVGNPGEKQSLVFEDVGVTLRQTCSLKQVKENSKARQ